MLFFFRQLFYIELTLKNSLENQLNVTQKHPIVQIFKIDFHLIGPNDIVVVPFWVSLLGKQFFLIAVFDAGWTSNARAELQYAAVVALKLVSITRYIRAWAYETHLPYKYIDQFSQTIHLTMAQPMADASDTQVAGNGDRVSFRLVGHGAELADTEGFAVFSDTCLHEKDRAIRIQFDEYGDDEQGKKQHNKSNECHNTVEAPLEEEPYFVFIFLHVAWPPC